MRNGLRVGRLFGITIYVDWSWLLIFLLVTWNLTTQFTQLHVGWGPSLTLVVAIGAALLFFASVLAHELAHLKEMNHSSRFWAVVEHLCPDYRNAENALKAWSVKLRIL